MGISVPCRISSGAFLTASVFMLQVSSLLLPVLGTVFCIAATVFAGVAGIFMGRRAGLVLLSSALLLIFISPRYALEFLITTGLAGGVLGVFLFKKPFCGLLVSSLSLFIGLTTVLYLFGAAAAGGCMAYLPVSACIPAFAVFSPAYCLLSAFLLKKLIRKAPLRRT